MHCVLQATFKLLSVCVSLFGGTFLVVFCFLMLVLALFYDSVSFFVVVILQMSVFTCFAVFQRSARCICLGVQKCCQVLSDLFCVSKLIASDVGEYYCHVHLVFGLNAYFLCFVFLLPFLVEWAGAVLRVFYGTFVPFRV